MTAVVRKLRCAIYTRKSTEEGLDQNYNSLDAQRDACQAYIKSQQSEGWVALHDTYDDLVPGERMNLPNTCPVDEFTLRDIVGEIEDAQLQQRLLRLCIDIANSDGRVDLAECIIISSAMDHWGLQREMFRPAS